MPDYVRVWLNNILVPIFGKVPRVKKTALKKASKVKLITKPTIRNNFGCIRWCLSAVYSTVQSGSWLGFI